MTGRERILDESSELEMLREIAEKAYELVMRSDMASVSDETFLLRNRLGELILEWRVLRG